MKKIDQLKIYFKENPVMAFVAIIVLVTIVLGGIAFFGSRSSAEDEDQIATEEKSKDSDKKDEDDEDETSDDDQMALKRNKKDKDDDDPTPTKKPTTSPTPDATSTPTTAPTSSKTPVNFLGLIIDDKNCNGVQDSGEGGIKDITVNLFKMPGDSAHGNEKTDGVGRYSYNTSIDEGTSLSLKAQPVVPGSTYVLKDGTDFKTVELKHGQNSGGQDFFFCPKE